MPGYEREVLKGRFGKENGLAIATMTKSGSLQAIEQLFCSFNIAYELYRIQRDSPYQG
jgi:hypothetical protein